MMARARCSPGVASYFLLPTSYFLLSWCGELRVRSALVTPSIATPLTATTKPLVVAAHLQRGRYVGGGGGGRWEVGGGEVGGGR